MVMEELRGLVEKGGIILVPFEDELIAAARDCAGILLQYAPITERVVAALPGLGIVSRIGAGFDTVDTDACAKHGVWVANSPDYGVGEVATHALGMALALMRNIVAYHRDVGAGQWHYLSSGRLFRASDMTLGIVGLGRIGKRMAHVGRNLFRQVIACDPYVDDGRFAGLGVERVSLEAVAERSDYVSVHTPLNAETHHLIGAAFFRRMKPTALLINTARGPVVDEAALARALDEKRLAGAALDVWEREPVAADNPLLRRDNVIATPHAAYFSSAAVAQVPRRCGEEVARVLTGQRPLNVVNPEVYAPGAARRLR